MEAKRPHLNPGFKVVSRASTWRRMPLHRARAARHGPFSWARSRAGARRF